MGLFGSNFDDRIDTLAEETHGKNNLSRTMIKAVDENGLYLPDVLDNNESLYRITMGGDFVENGQECVESGGFLSAPSDHFLVITNERILVILDNDEDPPDRVIHLDNVVDVQSNIEGKRAVLKIETENDRYEFTAGKKVDYIPDCVEYIREHLSGTDKESSNNNSKGSSVGSSEKTGRSPEEIANQATGDIAVKHLTKTGGIVSTWLHTEPLIEYIEDDEQPEFIFTGKSGAGLEIKSPDGEENQINGDSHYFLMITDQRILFVAGDSEGDKKHQIDYGEIQSVDTYSEMKITKWLSFHGEDGTEYRISVSGSKKERKKPVRYVNEKVGGSPLDYADLDCSPQNELVTEENVSNIDKLLEDGERVHFLAKDMNQGVEIVTGGRKETRDGWGGRTVWTAATDRRVVSSIPASLIGGSDEISISYDSVTSVDLEDMGAGVSDSNGVVDMMQSFIEKRLVIQTTSRTYRIDIGELSEETCRRMANFIREQANERNRKPEETEQNHSSSDPLEQIERLKQLNEQGAITDEEFQEKKSDLLDQV